MPQLAEIMTWDKVPEQFQSYPTEQEFDTFVAEFRKWRNENKVFYYARPREDFSITEGRKLAAEAGCTHVLLEDLS